MEPIVNGLEKEYEGRVAVRRIDANRDEGPKIVREHKILGHPTTILVDRNGKEQGRLLGPQEHEEIMALLEQVLATAAE